VKPHPVSRAGMDAFCQATNYSGCRFDRQPGVPSTVGCVKRAMHDRLRRVSRTQQK
jgi:hypothetical protein